jgi:hypothetical protein
LDEGGGGKTIVKDPRAIRDVVLDLVIISLFVGVLAADFVYRFDPAKKLPYVALVIEFTEELTDVQLLDSVQAALRARTKQPESVQFHNVRVVTASLPTRTSRFVCGEYRAENSFGWYSGLISFIGFGSNVFTEEDIELQPLLPIRKLLSQCE